MSPEVTSTLVTGSAVTMTRRTGVGDWAIASSRQAGGDPGEQVLPGHGAPQGVGDHREVQDLAVVAHHNGRISQPGQIPHILIEA